MNSIAHSEKFQNGTDYFESALLISIFFKMLIQNIEKEDDDEDDEEDDEDYDPDKDDEEKAAQIEDKKAEAAQAQTKSDVIPMFSS